MLIDWLYNKCVFIKTHGRVSAAKKAVWHTSMLFTGTANSPFSTPHISTTTVLISIKSHILYPPYTRPYIPNVKQISPVVHEIYVPENCPIFHLFLFSYSHCFTKVTLSQPKTPFPWIDFFEIWHTYKALYSLS